MLPFACPLLNRSLLRISGADRVSFLQALVSNDVTKATEDTGVYAALLTPQGKFLHDLFILATPDALLIDCEAGRADDLVQRLSAYKLRSQVEIENLADTFQVWAAWEAHLPQDWTANGLCFPDPRLPELGMRMFVDKGTLPTAITQVYLATYDFHRLALGVADGCRDLESGQSTLAEGNFDLLNGIDWKKGCYVGQELTARMRYRGLAKGRLFPVRIDGDPLPFGSPLMQGDSEVGEMRSSCACIGLALLKIDSAQQAVDQETPLTHGDTRVFVFTPEWMKAGQK